MIFEKINTSHGIIEVKNKDFSEPQEYLNIEKATENLLAVRKVLGEANVNFGLIYGTLLGAYRENNFIEHDYDTDLFVLEENKEELLEAVPKLLELGFEVCRYDGLLLSIIRFDEYIDFYFFRKSSFFYRRNDVGLKYKADFLEKTISYDFLGQTFQIPSNTESFLKTLYGINWKVPVLNDPASNHSNYIKIREYIKSNSSFLYEILSHIKRRFK